MALLLTAGAWTIPLRAQELTLTADSEASFRRFIHMAQQGELGADVTNANVALDGAQARIELVRRGAPAQSFVLTPQRAQPGDSRYFDIAPGAHATAADVALIGHALDRCFTEDPFQFAGLEESLARGPAPAITEAWKYGGWRGVGRALERRLMALASVDYVVTVLAALGVGFAASVLVLWSANPRRMT